VTGTGLFRIL